MPLDSTDKPENKARLPARSPLALHCHIYVDSRPHVHKQVFVFKNFYLSNKS